MNVEDQHVTLLVLLALNAAFHIVDHPILLDHLKFDFGISGSALKEARKGFLQLMYMSGQ